MRIILIMQGAKYHKYIQHLVYDRPVITFIVHKKAHPCQLGQQGVVKTL